MISKCGKFNVQITNVPFDKWDVSRITSVAGKAQAYHEVMVTQTDSGFETYVDVKKDPRFKSMSDEFDDTEKQSIQFKSQVLQPTFTMSDLSIIKLFKLVYTF